MDAIHRGILRPVSSGGRLAETRLWRRTIRFTILLWFPLTVLTLGPLTPLCAQDTLYVTDKLHLGLYKNKEGSGKQIRSLQSGSALTVLEQAGRYLKIRTEEGQEGWVKASFLVEKVPAIRRIAVMESQLAKAEAAVEARDSLQTENDGLKVQLGELKAQIRDLEIQAQNRANEPDARAVESASVNHTPQDDPSNAESSVVPASPQGGKDLLGLWHTPRNLLMLGGGMLVLLGIGFLVGVRWLDRHIRRKHDGYRVW